MKRLSLVFIALTFSYQASADPMDIKGIKPGMTLDELMTAYPEAKCMDVTTSPMTDQACVIPGVTYAGLGARMLAHLLEGKVSGVSITVDSQRFDTMVAALKEKYGAPASSTDQPIQTKMGVTLTNTRVKWRQGTSMLTAERYGSKVTESFVMLIDANDAERSQTKKKQDAQRRSQDL